MLELVERFFGLIHEKLLDISHLPQQLFLPAGWVLFLYVIGILAQTIAFVIIWE
jgi:hypothetical protein